MTDQDGVNAAGTLPVPAGILGEKHRCLFVAHTAAGVSAVWSQISERKK